jgi:hypothetical protein
MGDVHEGRVSSALYAQQSWAGGANPVTVPGCGLLQLDLGLILLQQVSNKLPNSPHCDATGYCS